MTQQKTQLIHEGNFAAEIDVTLISSEDGWSPRIQRNDVLKLDRVRLALRSGNISKAQKEARVFKLVPMDQSTSGVSVMPKGNGFDEPSQETYTSRNRTTMTQIRTGIGGWTFDEWRKTFYPPEVKKKDELEYASRALKTIEINGTYYRGQKPETFAKWRDATPDGFVFAVKGNRFVTIKKKLAEAGESMEKFFATGVTELGDRLGPLLWQFAPTKQFDPEDFDAFLAMLPRERDGIKLRHAVEVRHDSFCVPEFIALARKHNVAVVYALHEKYPAIADVTSDFIYARLQTGSDEVETCYGANELGAWADRFKTWANGQAPDDLPLIAPDAPADSGSRDVFGYLIASGKSRAPAGAMALQKMLN